VDRSDSESGLSLSCNRPFSVINSRMLKKVVIVGAGPAGLTAAAELQENGTHVTVIEKDPEYVGGIARTVCYKGYRFDIGGHRFFSKNGEITQWWKDRLGDEFIKVRRLSRIYYRGKFFDYPLKPGNALFGLGIGTSIACGLSYLKSKMFPIRPERSFADWVTNRFGRKLFSIFFRTYTEKVWGMPCEEISADWAAQRIKGLSLVKAVLHALVKPKAKGGEVVKTLIDAFEYPRLGPGMMWEKTAADIRAAGGEVTMGTEVVGIERGPGEVKSVRCRDASGREWVEEGDAFIVSMPLKETILKMNPPAPPEVQAAAQALRYRDFLTVALMVRQTDLFPDNWIYVHDPEVKLGRIQNFNNWSAEMVPQAGVTCLGLEYFCNENDSLWSMRDEDLVALGTRELAQLKLVDPATVIDGAVVRMEKAYPVYDESYQGNVDVIRAWLSGFSNIQPVGRNGMHKYNNQDHSMMSALIAARRLTGRETRDPWKVNTDAEYHESAIETRSAGRGVPMRTKP
jgi:protoporphyrinogen oxidase